jgi:hypothetical protein
MFGTAFGVAAARLRERLICQGGAHSDAEGYAEQGCGA